MTALRRMRAEIPRPHPDRLTTGRERLQAAISAEQAAVDAEEAAPGAVSRRPFFMGEHMQDTEPGSRNPVRRRTLLSVAVAVAAAVAVTATVVVADDIGDRKGSSDSAPAAPDSSGSPSPSAQEIRAKKVLRAAAERVRNGPESAVPRDDQFVYTKNLARETDRKTGKSKTYTDESWTSADLSKRSWNESLGEGHWSGPQSEIGGNWPHYDWSELKKLPTDPVKLILAVRKPMGPPVKATSLKQVRKLEWQGIHADLTGFVTAAPVLPKALRAAALDALAIVPETRAESGVEDIEGRPGIAISSKSALFKEMVLIFDERDYEFRGSTGVRTPDEKTYDQLFHLEEYAIVDKAKQQP